MIACLDGVVRALLEAIDRALLASIPDIDIDIDIDIGIDIDIDIDIDMEGHHTTWEDRNYHTPSHVVRHGALYGQTRSSPVVTRREKPCGRDKRKTTPYRIDDHTLPKDKMRPDEMSKTRQRHGREASKANPLTVDLVPSAWLGSQGGD